MVSCPVLRKVAAVRGVEQIVQQRCELAGRPVPARVFHRFLRLVPDLDIGVAFMAVFIGQIRADGIDRLPSVLGPVAFIARGQLAAEKIRQHADEGGGGFLGLDNDGIFLHRDEVGSRRGGRWRLQTAPGGWMAPAEGVRRRRLGLGVSRRHARRGFAVAKLRRPGIVGIRSGIGGPNQSSGPVVVGLGGGCAM